MMRFVLSLLAGGLFGAGLLISGMTDTRKVIGWLDVFGSWDPTLAFVMGGAIIPMAIAWRLTLGRAPLVGGRFPDLRAGTVTVSVWNPHCFRRRVNASFAPEDQTARNPPGWRAERDVFRPDLP